MKIYTQCLNSLKQNTQQSSFSFSKGDLDETGQSSFGI